MNKKMLESNRTSNSQGKNISIYLRGEHLKTLKLLCEVLGKNKSETIQHLLEITQKFIDAYMKENAELVNAMLLAEAKKIMMKQAQQSNETRSLKGDSSEV
ncbi:MAG: hypothetical protein QW674_07220 [Candidatus Bathyarchaeia archaeon]